jgi:hypothetical protein
VGFAMFAMQDIFTKEKRYGVLVLMMVLQVGWILASFTDSFAANKFNKGDFVKVSGSTIGLQVLNDPGGKKIETKSDMGCWYNFRWTPICL